MAVHCEAAGPRDQDNKTITKEIENNQDASKFFHGIEFGLIDAVSVRVAEEHELIEEQKRRGAEETIR